MIYNDYVYAKKRYFSAKREKVEDMNTYSAVGFNLNSAKRPVVFNQSHDLNEVETSSAFHIVEIHV